MKIDQIQVENLHSIKSLKSFKNNCDFLMNLSEISGDYEKINKVLFNFYESQISLFSSITELNNLFPLQNFNLILLLNSKVEEFKTHIIKEETAELNFILTEILATIKEWINTHYLSVKQELENITSEYSKLFKRKISKDLLKSENTYLFHGTRAGRAKEALSRGSILGYTTQKYWTDGKRKKDKDPKHDEYFLMKGISMTRDLSYALSWNDVVLIFDKKIIEQKHAIEPYAWNYSFDHNAHAKKEREEFVVLKKTGKKFKNSENQEWMADYSDIVNEDLSGLNPEDKKEYEELKKEMELKKDLNHIGDISAPYGEFEFTNSGALVGIILKSYVLEIFGKNNQDIEYIINHPLFWGILED